MSTEVVCRRLERSSDIYYIQTFACFLDWQTRTHCCVPFSRARNICCGQQVCVWDTKDVSDFVQKHFVSANNVSQFAQHGNTTFILCPKKHHQQQCVRNDVSLFVRAFMRAKRERESRDRNINLTAHPQCK